MSKEPVRAVRVCGRLALSRDQCLRIRFFLAPARPLGLEHPWREIENKNTAPNKS